MENLLDTHTLLWFLNGDDQLSERARKAIEKKGRMNFVSIASIWEIAIKISLGKLEMESPFNTISEQMDANGFNLLPITFADTIQLLDLPLYHKDPFDRIIISQSITNNLTIISRDKAFQDYELGLFW